MHSTEEEVWCAMDMRIRNTGTEELNVFHLVFYGGGNELFGIVADKDANLYKPVDVINPGTGGYPMDSFSLRGDLRGQSIL